MPGALVSISALQHFSKKRKADWLKC